ncbi:hypothetical protein PTSG_01720 [Salpingoeca rosetta]|uniref:TMC domain-containing protein n=1 Tax=Salpingoeca rosetta (strain ATCC 50818 / BSB-021) TaxID=946362 RepID=F2TYR7_SALR5|nr:uncharacterized protein PTSG_01720 [Salpingoeca rosetta]EGD78741.1 hypothetical protein PTSG_01720 [Salpingoeca rosetta]|eukprot:XP_004997698.1 hypothetical protein PTSG_01720 [Salpingoeca rosetta]
MVVWRTFTFTLALAIVVGVWFGIDSVNKRYANSSDSLEALLPALTLAAVNAIGPTVFWRMARTVERYSPLAVLKLTLLRSFLLRIVSLYVILTSLFGINLSDMQLAQESCWETLIGQELYRVLLVDTGFAFVTVILYDTPRYLIYEHGQGYAMFDFINRNLGPPQFFLTSSILSGIYRQTLIWLGTFYSPLLPFLGAILNTILVVGKSLAMFRVQRPSQYAFDIHNFKQLYIGLLLLSVLLSLSPVVYSLANLTPSPYCGPFRNYTDISSVVTAMISDAPKHLQEALSVLGQPTVVVPVVFVLLIATYYFFRKSQLQAAQFAQAQRLAADTHDAFKLVTRLQRTQPSSSSSQQAQQAQPP